MTYIFSITDVLKCFVLTDVYIFVSHDCTSYLYILSLSVAFCIKQGTNINSYIPEWICFRGHFLSALFFKHCTDFMFSSILSLDTEKHLLHVVLGIDRNL
jgi:hypothetical protein